MSVVSTVQVGLAGPAAWIRIGGRGTFQNSAGLKEFAAAMQRRGLHELVIDLKDCELMDSTFLGTLTGIALGLGAAGKLTVVRANARNREVMHNLGLDRIFAVEDTLPAPVPGHLENAEPVAARRETILEAHESLVAANPENAIRFKDVLEFLRHETREQPHP